MINHALPSIPHPVAARARQLLPLALIRMLTIWAVMLCSGLAANQLQASDQLPVRVRVEAPWYHVDAPTPVWISLTNLAQRDLDYTINLDASPNATRQTVALAAGETRQLWLPIAPGVDDYGSVVITARGLSGLFHTSVHLPQTSLVVCDPASRLPSAVLQAVNDHWADGAGITRSHSSSSTPDVRHIRADLFPPHALWYPRDTLLLLSDEAWRSLNAVQQQALADWAHWGGSLATMDFALAEVWQKAAIPGMVIGTGRPRELASLTRDEVDEQGILNRVRVLDGSGDGVQQSLRALARDRRALANGLGIEVESPDWALPGTEERGRWLLGALVGFFFVLAGPGVVWWSKRRGQPWRLLVLAPVLGVGVCFLLIIVDIAALGLGRDRSMVELTVLDQHRQQALVAHGIASFGGFRMGSWVLPPTTVVFDGERIKAQSDRYFYYRRRGEIDPWVSTLDGDMIHRGNLFPARATGHLATLALHSERRRLRMVVEDGQRYVENDLGVAIEAALWRSRDGAWWRSQDIGPGQRGVLREAAGQIEERPDRHSVVLPPSVLREAAGQIEESERGEWLLTEGPFRLRPWDRLKYRLPAQALQHWKPQPERLFVRLGAALYPVGPETGVDREPPLRLLTTILQDPTPSEGSQP